MQRQTNAATEQTPWASAICSAIRAFSQSSLLTPERRNTSLTPALCKKYAHCIPNLLLAFLVLTHCPAPAHTTESSTGAEPAQQRSAHDRCPRGTYGPRHAGLQSTRRLG